MHLKEKLWIWGQDAGTHHLVLNNAWNLPGENKMGPVEGANYLGIPNICRVTMGNKPEPPFDNEMEKLKDFDNVVWSIIGDNGSNRNDTGGSDLEAVIALSKKFNNLVGGIMDDFFSPKRMAVYTPEVIGQYTKALHEAGLKLWTVYYEHQLEMDLSAWLEQCDVISFWTWRAEDLSKLEENLAKLEGQLTKGQKIYAGCYMYDYGDCKEMPADTMRYQLEVYKKWLQEGRIEGIVICSNCIADIGLEAVDVTRKWIAENCEI